MMVICWKPNQKTAVHTHNGQLGWMQMAQGEVAVHNYKYLTCDCPERQNVVGLDCLGGAKHLSSSASTPSLPDGTGIYQVDKLQSIHQIENTDKSDKGVVSLHVYSLPFDSCIAFNMDAGTCCRKQLSYYSKYGKVEGEIEHRKDDEYASSARPAHRLERTTLPHLSSRAKGEARSRGTLPSTLILHRKAVHGFHACAAIPRRTNSTMSSVT